MPQHATSPDFLQRLAVLERQVAQLTRSGRALLDELPFYPTEYETMPWQDVTSFASSWETTFSPRTASLSMGLTFLGDQVGGVNTGGAWQILLNGAVAAAGIVAPTWSFQFATAVFDLSPYLTASDVHVEIQVRRTVGATTGGMYGFGGSIAIAPSYARLL